nr:hypothetical protein [Rhodopirellula sallentina]
MHHACLETGTGEGTFRCEVVVPGSFNDDNRVLDLMLLLSLANEYDGSLEMSRLMFKRLRFDEQLPEVIGHHPFRAILSWIDRNDCKSVTTDLGNAIRDGTTWLLQMLSVLGTRLCVGTTSTTAEFTGHDTLQIEE